MTITIEASPTFTLVIYPKSDRVVWIMGLDRKSSTTSMEQAMVILQTELNRRRNERPN